MAWLLVFLSPMAAFLAIEERNSFWIVMAAILVFASGVCFAFGWTDSV